MNLNEEITRIKSLMMENDLGYKIQTDEDIHTVDRIRVSILTHSDNQMRERSIIRIS